MLPCGEPALLSTVKASVKDRMDGECLHHATGLVATKFQDKKEKRGKKKLVFTKLIKMKMLAADQGLCESRS